MALYAFDGTWQKDEDEAAFDGTNVARFRDVYEGEVFYYLGIGTRGGKILRAVAGATGLGGELRVEEAKDDLDARIEAGDTTVDIVGFSRGAALAVDFANEIDKQVRGGRARVRFLGLFDTVHSFGVAGVDFNLFHDPDVPDYVEHCFHALALDERRQTFPPTRAPTGYEVWFRGVHSDIGGGNDNAGLNNIALRWMLHKAILAGLPIKAGIVDTLETDPEAAIQPAGFDPVKDPFRVLQAGDRIHYSVSSRAEGEHSNPPESMPRESEQAEREALSPA